MANVIDFGPQYNARMQFAHKMMAGQPSATAAFFKQQRGEALKRENLASLEAQRLTAEEVARGKLGVEQERLAAQKPKYDAETLKAQAQAETEKFRQVELTVKAKLEASGIPKNIAEAEAAKAAAAAHRAAAEASLAKAGADREKAAATHDWRVNSQNEAITRNARNVYNMGIANALSGNPNALSKDNADRQEAAGQALYGPSFRLPRDANGNWTPDMKQLANSVLDDKGVPKGDFAKNLAEAEKAKTPLEQWIRAAQEAQAKGDMPTARLYLTRVAKEITPNESQAKGKILWDAATRGDVDTFNKLITTWRGGGGKGGGAGSQAVQTRVGNINATLSVLDKIDGKIDNVFTDNPMKVDSHVQEMTAWSKAHLGMGTKQQNADAEMIRKLPSYRATIARAMGDVGRLSQQEEINVQKAMPDLATDTRQQAHNKISNMREILTGVRESLKSDPSGSPEEPTYHAIALRAGAGLPLDDLVEQAHAGPKAPGATPPDDRDMSGLTGAKTSIGNAQAQLDDLRKQGIIPPGSEHMTANELFGAIAPSNENALQFQKTLNQANGDYQRNVIPHGTNDKDLEDLGSVNIDPEKDNLDTIVQKLQGMQDRTDRVTKTLGGVGQVHGVDTGTDTIKPTDHVSQFGPPDTSHPAGQRMDDAVTKQNGIDAVGADVRRKGLNIGGVDEVRGSKDVGKYREGLKDPELQKAFDALSPDNQLRVMTGTD